MSTVRELHERAMEYAHLAMLARDHRESDTARNHAQTAFALELQAAQLVPHSDRAEPTRSILYRSAASLAYQSGNFNEAIRVIGLGISGNPPPKILADLLSLLDQVKFNLYLQSLDDSLSNDGLLLTIRGSAVGSGLILYPEFKRRFDNVILLINKTVQRLTHRRYNRGGRDRAEYNFFQKAIEIPAMQNSFAMTIRLVTPEDEQRQLNLLGATPESVIDEVVLGVDMINNNQEEQLQAHINDNQYYTHFVNTVKHMAPDGEKISQVGIASSRQGISLTRNRAQISSVVPAREPESEPARSYTDLVVRGQLRYADDLTSGEHAMGLEQEGGNVIKIKPSEGFDEILAQLWKSQIEVSGKFDGLFLYPEEITPLDE